MTPRTVRMRISSGFCSTSALRPASGSRDDLQGLALVQAPLERRRASRPCARNAATPRAAANRAPRARAGQAAQRGEVGEVELQAAEDVVERVVARDDDVDGGTVGGGWRRSGCDRGRGDGVGGCRGRGGVCGGGGRPGRAPGLPCRSDQATTAQAPAWSQNTPEGQRSLGKRRVGGVFWSIDYTCRGVLTARTVPGHARRVNVC